MDAPHQSYTENCVQLLRKVESAVADIIHTLDISSDRDRLTEKLKPWADLLAKLIEEIHQKGHILKTHESEETGIVFLVLTSGMAETVELLQVPHHHSSQSLRQLKSRVALHIESTFLILAHLDRECTRHMPNAQMELGKMDTRWFDQKTQLEGRLKEVFKCSSSALLWERPAVTIDFPGGRSFLSAGPLPSPDSTSMSFLSALQAEAAKSLPGFPPIMSLLRVSVYLLGTLRASIEDVNTGSLDNLTLSILPIDLYKCAWVIHNLVNHNQLKVTHKGIKQIIELILEEMMPAFVTYDAKPLPGGSLPNLESCDLSLNDPLSFGRATDRAQSIKDIEKDLYTATKPNNPVFANLATLSPLRGQKDETPDAESIQYSSTQTAAKPGEEQLDDPDDPISLIAAASDTVAQSSDRLEPNFSSINIFKELKSGNFRICCQDKYVVSETIVKPEMDEIVFQSRPPVLRLRRGNKNIAFFSTTSSKLEDIMFFSNYLTRDSLDTQFQISGISFRSQKHSGDLAFSNCFAQVWTACDVESRRSSIQSRKSTEIPESELGFGSRRCDSIGALSQRIEVSRILFFCDSSIYTILLTNQIYIREEDSATSTTLTFYFGNEKISSLPIHITKGTPEHPAGIPLSFGSTSRNLHYSNTNCREYSSIRLIFPDREGINDFIKVLNICCRKWQAKAIDIKKQLDQQRNQVIETKSQFH